MDWGRAADDDARVRRYLSGDGADPAHVRVRGHEGGIGMARYEIVVDGVVGPVVMTALEGFEVHPDRPGRSRLVGQVLDQAALHGVLNRLRDLRVEIIDVRRVEDS
jgi:hypothetical protein